MQDREKYLVYSFYCLYFLVRYIFKLILMHIWVIRDCLKTLKAVIICQKRRQFWKWLEIAAKFCL